MRSLDNAPVKRVFQAVGSLLVLLADPSRDDVLDLLPLRLSVDDVHPQKKPSVFSVLIL